MGSLKKPIMGVVCVSTKNDRWVEKWSDYKELG